VSVCKICEKVTNGFLNFFDPRNNRLDFGGDPYNDPDPGMGALKTRERTTRECDTRPITGADNARKDSARTEKVRQRSSAQRFGQRTAV